MKIEINMIQSIIVEEQIEKVLQMETDRQGLEQSRYTPKIISGRTEPKKVDIMGPTSKVLITIPLAVLNMIQLRGNANPKLIVIPKVQAVKVSEDLSKEPKEEQKNAKEVIQAEKPAKVVVQPQHSQQLAK